MWLCVAISFRPWCREYGEVEYLRMVLRIKLCIVEGGDRAELRHALY